MKISDMLLISDMDGTIIPSGGTISEKNLNAIKKFKNLGGSFTVATGRSPKMAKRFIDILGLDSAVICSNGGQIFDPKKGIPVWNKELPYNYIDIIEKIIKKYPCSIGVEAIDVNDNYFTLYESEYLARIFKNDTIVHNKVSLKDAPKECMSVLFLIDHDVYELITNEIYNMKFNEVVFIKSGGDCFEMMPTGVNKAAPFEKLLDIYGKSAENTIVIGDFYNDIEIMSKAKIGVAVDNATDELKEKANIIVKSCEEDGLAELITYLINNADNL